MRLRERENVLAAQPKVSAPRRTAAGRPALRRQNHTISAPSHTEALVSGSRHTQCRALTLDDKNRAQISRQSATESRSPNLLLSLDTSRQWAGWRRGNTACSSPTHPAAASGHVLWTHMRTVARCAAASAGWNHRQNRIEHQSTRLNRCHERLS